MLVIWSDEIGLGSNLPYRLLSPNPLPLRQVASKTNFVASKACHHFSNSINLQFYFLSVKVKWGRENFPNIEVNTDEEPLLFKAQLYALTGVQPDRQKVMCKGLALKDAEWNMELKDV